MNNQKKREMDDLRVLNAQFVERILEYSKEIYPGISSDQLKSVEKDIKKGIKALTGFKGYDFEFGDVKIGYMLSYTTNRNGLKKICCHISSGNNTKEIYNR